MHWLFFPVKRQNIHLLTTRREISAGILRWRQVLTAYFRLRTNGWFIRRMRRRHRQKKSRIQLRCMKWITSDGSIASIMWKMESTMKSLKKNRVAIYLYCQVRSLGIPRMLSLRLTERPERRWKNWTWKKYLIRPIEIKWIGRIWIRFPIKKMIIVSCFRREICIQQ